MHEKARKSNARRKPFDVVLMFKMLVLQTLYNLADEQVEYRIRDRLSFSRFLGLGIEDAVPDATTVWRFRERLQEQGLLETVFDRFDDFLAAEGFEARQGSLMLPSLRCRFPAITARRTAGSRRVRFPKDGRGAKRAQKGVDGRWTRKRGNHSFGNKNHISIDAEHKIIRRFQTTPAHMRMKVSATNR